MKRFTLMALVAAVGLAMASCAREAIDNQDSIINIVADGTGVKTALNGSPETSFTTSWTKGDAIVLWRTTSDSTSSAVSAALAEDCSCASFAVTMPASDGGQTFTAVYPSSAVSVAQNVSTVSIPENQTSCAASFDPAADLLIAGPVTRTGEVSELQMQFCRLGSIVRVEVLGLKEGESLSKVSLVSDTRLAGSYSWNSLTGEAEVRSEASGKVCITASSDTNVVAARVMSGTHNSLSFTITTTAGSYEKQCPGTVILADNTVNCFKLAVDTSSTATGTEDAPYLIYDVDDLLDINSHLEYGKITYFKLMNNLNLSSVKSWPVLNVLAGANANEIQFSQGIDFDGGGHTISNLTANQGNNYAGFIGVLYGKVHDITFENPIVSGSKAAGVVCGYAGTGSYVGNIENVTITNGQVTQNGNAHIGLVFGTNGVPGTYSGIKAEGTVTMSVSAPIVKNKSATGGIAGSSTASSFTDCSFTGTINGARHCGGIVGYERTAGSKFSGCSVDATINVRKINSVSSEDAGGIVGYIEGGTIENCCTKGSVTAVDQVVGGIAGEISNLVTIRDCWSADSLKAGRVCGGIVARACHGNWDKTSAKDLDIDGCVFWGSIDVSSATSANGSSGAIVGYTNLNNVVGGCWRKDSMKFTSGNEYNFPADQPDGCSGWVPGQTAQVGTGTSPTQYLFPYWGKASSESSVSATVTAKSLGWDTAVWDLTAAEPKLKH